MNKEQFIATLQACYFGDKGAYNKILSLYDENKELHNKIDKAIEKINFYKNTEWGLRSLSILETFEEILKDSDVDE